jgi:hypothetical protein
MIGYLNKDKYNELLFSKMAPEIENLGFGYMSADDSCTSFRITLYSETVVLLIDTYYRYKERLLEIFDIRLMALSGKMLFKDEAKLKKGNKFLQDDDVLETFDHLITFLTEE